MVVFLIILAVLLIGLAAAFVLGRRAGLSMGMPEPVSSAAGRGLPPGEEITSHALGAVRFDRAVRGYRMDQVDAVLDRLRAELADREARLGELATAGGGVFPVVSLEDELRDIDHYPRPEDL